jgi:hypothetical protein
MRRFWFLSSALAAGLLLALSGGAAYALPTSIPTGSLGLSLTLGTPTSGTEIYAPVFVGQADPGTGPYAYTWNDGTWSGSGAKIQWSNVEGDLDPGVSGVWSVTNNTGTTQIYTLSIILPVLPVVPSSLMFGSSTLSVSDANFDGSATLASVTPFATYNGLIDLAAVPAAALFADPYSLVVSSGGGTTGATASFGSFPGTVPGPAVAGSIGIQHVFSLSAGDSATLNSTFFLQAVPEPGTLMLAVSGLLGIGLLARRHS